MNYFSSLILISILSITNILSYPTPIRRSTCLPNVCIVEPAFCFCGFEESPNDPCCNYRCTPCPANFTFPWMTFEIGPLNFFPLGPLNFSGIDFSIIGRR